MCFTALDEDYYLLPTSQSFIVGDTNGATITFNVNIASDDFVELDESIILTVVHPHFRGALFPNRRLEIRVSDSDGTYIVIVVCNTYVYSVRKCHVVSLI